MSLFVIMLLTHILTAILAGVAGFYYRGKIKKKLGED